MSLSQAIPARKSLPTQAALVVGGSLFIAIAAQVTVPMFPVPMTLQTLAILIVGLTYGARLGLATLVAYLAEGFAGLPVFSNGGAGPAYFFGPTCGFLLGFAMMAWLAGLAADAGLTRRLVPAALVALGVSALLYLPGIAWPLGLASAFGIEGGWTQSSPASLWSGWVAPFLVGDAVKAVLAALVVTGGMAALRARRG